MVTNNAKDGHSLEESIIHPENLAIKLNSQNQNLATTVMDGHLLSLGWSHTNPRRVPTKRKCTENLQFGTKT